jgi:transcriptional regulator GlxA family with amidase domain
MPRIGILCFDDTYLFCAAGFADVLGVGNVHLRDARVHAVPFECIFLSEKGGPVSANGGLSIGTQAAATAGILDVVVIPTIHYPGYKRFARYAPNRPRTGDKRRHHRPAATCGTTTGGRSRSYAWNPQQQATR